MVDGQNRDITYLRISVTDLCNLRCKYCMPEEGQIKKKHGEMMMEEELVQAVEVAASLGIKKVRLTGGEPLVKKNIVSICEKISKTEGIEEVCLTTNGILMKDLAEPLKKAGVSRINISLDTLNPEKYHSITRWGNLEDFFKGFEATLAAGFRKVKVNVVLIGGFNDDEIVPLAELTKKYPVDVRFIEMMPMIGNKDYGESAYVSSEVVLAALPEAYSVEPDGGVAKLYRLPGAQGNIGLITPISAHFCGECNRIRLTADGKIKPCLHSNAEYYIKGKDKETVQKIMEEAIYNKPSWHGDLDINHKSQSGRTMNQIGG